jgi:hypothetical protein
MSSERMEIGYEEIAVIMLLHFNKAFYRSKIIANVLAIGRSNSTYNCFHFKKFLI